MSTASATPADLKYLTPPQIAARLGVAVKTVRGWCASGEMRSCNLAARGRMRPRIKISPVDLEIFLERRSAGPQPKAIHNRRRKENEGRHEYF